MKKKKLETNDRKKKMDLIQQCTVYSMINFRPDKFLKTKVITNNKTTNK